MIRRFTNSFLMAPIDHLIERNSVVDTIHVLRLIFNEAFALTRIYAIVCTWSGTETLVIIGRWCESNELGENRLKINFLVDR